MNPIESKILSRLERKGKGALCTASDFMDFGNRAALDQALSRLVKKGTLKRFARGIYLLPQINSIAGELLPDPVQLAETAARKTGAKLLIGEAYAAYTLGLTQQIPAKIDFLTDGKAQNITVGALSIQLKQASPRKLATAGRASGQVFQALRFLGKDQIDPSIPIMLREKLTERQKKEIAADLKFAPVWMQEVIRQIIGKGKME